MHQYVVIVEKSTLPEDIKLLKKCSDDHLDYLKNLQKSGNLKIAGKFTDETGGMYMLLANNDDEAHTFAKNDPYYINNLIKIEIKQWDQKV
jgi:uncharacterized protein YciI